MLEIDLYKLELYQDRKFIKSTFGSVWVGLEMTKNAFERDLFHVITFLQMFFHLFQARGTSVILVESSEIVNALFLDMIGVRETNVLNQRIQWPFLPN